MICIKRHLFHLIFIYVEFDTFSCVWIYCFLSYKFISCMYKSSQKKKKIFFSILLEYDIIIAIL